MSISRTSARPATVPRGMLAPATSSGSAPPGTSPTHFNAPGIAGVLGSTGTGPGSEVGGSATGAATHADAADVEHAVQNDTDERSFGLSADQVNADVAAATQAAADKQNAALAAQQAAAKAATALTVLAGMVAAWELDLSNYRDRWNILVSAQQAAAAKINQPWQAVGSLPFGKDLLAAGAYLSSIAGQPFGPQDSTQTISVVVDPTTGATAPVVVHYLNDPTGYVGVCLGAFQGTQQTQANDWTDALALYTGNYDDTNGVQTAFAANLRTYKARVAAVLGLRSSGSSGAAVLGLVALLWGLA